MPRLVARASLQTLGLASLDQSLQVAFDDTGRQPAWVFGHGDAGVSRQHGLARYGGDSAGGRQDWTGKIEMTA